MDVSKSLTCGYHPPAPRCRFETRMGWSLVSGDAPGSRRTRMPPGARPQPRPDRQTGTTSEGTGVHCGEKHARQVIPRGLVRRKFLRPEHAALRRFVQVAEILHELAQEHPRIPILARRSLLHLVV